MTVLTKQVSVLLQRQHIAVRINACLIQLIQGYQLVAYLITGIA